MQKSQDPRVILQTAIEELEVFTRAEATRLEIGQDGRLVAAKESRLERVVGLARCYIGSFFFEQVRKEQDRQFLKLKKAILRVRDVIQSHSALIEQFKEGDAFQRKLAESALLIIQRYNVIVAQDFSKCNRLEGYNYERQQLLLDQEIKGQQIELSRSLSVKYQPHSGHPAHKMLQELSQVLHDGATHKKNTALAPIHKKNLQFMIDAFHMKAIRLIEAHLQRPIAEIVPLVKQTLPEIDQENQDDLITMRQRIKVDEGYFILVTGCFKRHLSHTKFMTMPILESLRSSIQMTHTGFPYPSQHTGWALGEHWVEALPLRADQTPLFQKIYQRRKHLVQRLLVDQAFMQKVSRYFKIKREVFDQNRQIFLPLHRQLQLTLQKETRCAIFSILDAFYQEALEAPSAFDYVVETQQQILNLFIKQPLHALEEEWLGVSPTPLRVGSAEEKFQTACLRLEQCRRSIQESFEMTTHRQNYILQQGMLLGQAFQSIALQYQSEKIGFAPPLLEEFERKLQACAFRQLILFLDECEQNFDLSDPDLVKENLLVAWSKDLQLLAANRKEEHILAFDIINELERYFNARFYSPFHEEGLP